MITVFEGFMIVSGSISGNLVLDEKEGQPALSLIIYCVAIGIILAGLQILLVGEKAANDAKMASGEMTPAAHHPKKVRARGGKEEKASLSAEHGREDERMRREAELEMAHTPHQQRYSQDSPDSTPG